jgi:SAM-dependent methyltransferase
VAAEDRTIRDFGDQWSHYADNEGYYGSLELLRDVLGPLLPLEALRGARVAEVGSGAGRIVRMLLDAGAAQVVAVEPSAGVEALRANTRDVAGRVEILHAAGEALPAGLGLDYVFAIGVLPFVRDPLPLLRAARQALRPGGRLVVWVYGVEGNRLYLGLLRGLRVFTTRLPHAALDALCGLLNRLLDLYIALCRWLPLPLRSYVRGTLARVSRAKRHLTIYDQLNPSFVHFYRGAELRALLEWAGFGDVRLHHRRGYSWTALALRDAPAPEREPAA